MSSSFQLRLDTQTHLAVELEAGPEPNTIVLRLLADADVEDFKVWGAIDPTDPGNSEYAENQGDAEWFSFREELTIRVAPGEGQKVFHVQTRDDVWNESAIQTVKFGVSPEEKVVPTPGWPGGKREEPRKPRRRNARRKIESVSVIGTSTSTTLVERRRRAESSSVVHVRLSAHVHRRNFIAAASTISVGSTFALRVRARGDVQLVGVISESTIVKRRGRADDDAIAALFLT